MKSATRTALTVSLGLFYGFSSDFVAYLSGIRDQGGTLGDIDGISIAVMVSSAIATALAALMLLLAEPPEGGLIVAREPKPIDIFLEPE